jgi:hypothetical protein
MKLVWHQAADVKLQTSAANAVHGMRMVIILQFWLEAAGWPDINPAQARARRDQPSVAV